MLMTPKLNLTRSFGVLSAKVRVLNKTNRKNKIYSLLSPQGDYK